MEHLLDQVPLAYNSVETGVFLRWGVFLCRESFRSFSDEKTSPRDGGSDSGAVSADYFAAALTSFFAWSATKLATVAMGVSSLTTILITYCTTGPLAATWVIVESSASWTPSLSNMVVNILLVACLNAF